MDLTQYQRELARIGFGKSLPAALYVYRDPQTSLGETLDRLLARLADTFEIGPEFNLLKFRTDELKLSFLCYPDFFEDPHPALRRALTIDLVRGRARLTDYGHNPNPPILHRKETFLPPDHPKRSLFAALTAAEEAAGLYADPATIGFKLNWERLLAARGLRSAGHRLVAVPASADPAAADAPALPAPRVERHKTALVRYELSKPVKSLLEYGLLRPGASFFDYGCGQGADVAGLRNLGHAATGWDPVHSSQADKAEADLVNLGYVLNVIEDPAERLETLVDAYRCTRRVLVVSTLIRETVQAELATVFRDGVLTRRNTFQKYFEQQELQQYIEDALDTTAVPVALGVFYVFRDPVEQQDFIAARTRRAIDWTQVSARLGLGQPRQTRWQLLYEQHRELLDASWETTLRLPDAPALLWPHPRSINIEVRPGPWRCTAPWRQRRIALPSRATGRKVARARQGPCA